MFGLFRKNKKTKVQEFVDKVGLEAATEKFSQMVLETLKDKHLLYQLILEEIEGASIGNEVAKAFAGSSGISPDEYKGALTRSHPEIDGPNGSKTFLDDITMQLMPDRELMVRFRLMIDDKLLRKTQLGKYCVQGATNRDGDDAQKRKSEGYTLQSEKTGKLSEAWVDSLCKWADDLGLKDLKWEVQPRNRDGGFWTGFPRDAKRIKELSGLNIQNMAITELPCEIGNLKHLRKLWASGNNLTKIPDEICNLPQLEEIDLEGNKITAIPDAIGKLKRLRILDLRSNELKYVPESIRNLTALERLDLRDQPINLGHVDTPLTDDQVRAIAALGDVVRW